MPAPAETLEQLASDGHCSLQQVFDRQQMTLVASRLAELLENPSDPAILRSRGKAYGSRSLLRVLPEAAELARHPLLTDFLHRTVGDGTGLVRGLFFDKPPELTWSLPWHRDSTIAVADHSLPSEHFRQPTTKAGIAHVVGPTWLLEKMLTLRIHIDDMTKENGPLLVAPGSHLLEEGQPQRREPIEVHADAGDVFAMRPLISHSSRPSTAGTFQHRRVIHLEFAPSAELPDGYQWSEFIPI
jgi:ectoine hydroxylase-related dioxygenase (phytanoyl-CoA dioxygenase family)